MERTELRQTKGVGRLPLQTARQPKTAESGQTLMEFALLLPFLMLVLLGIAELGRAAFITITVSRAATAGAAYGAQNAATASQTGPGTPLAMTMPEAALCDANGDNGRTCAYGILTQVPVAQNGCTCDTGTGTSCHPFPGPSNCSNYSCAGQIVECVRVTTHANFSPLFHYPGLPTTFQANGTSIMRVRR